MPLREDPADPRTTVLVDADGRPLATTQLHSDAGVAGRTRVLPDVDPADAAHRALDDLAGLRLATTDAVLATALVAQGAVLHRVALDLTHDLSDVPAPPSLPGGWSLAPGRWDADLAAAAAEAYAPGHPDGAWSEADSAEVSEVLAGTGDVVQLAPATAVLLDPDGRSAGHVLCAGPVPWVDEGAWVLTVAVAERGRGLGLGRALVLHALRGTRESGQPRLGLSVTVGNPARRLYESVGFRPVTRTLSLRLPARPANTR